MPREFDRLGETPGQRIASVIKFLVHHRGIEGEHGLVSAFGEARLREIYGGDEPRFSELEEIASVLAVPISTFQITSPGDFAELEIAWAEISYRALSMGRRDRERLAFALLNLIRADDDDSPNLLDELRIRTPKA